MAREKEGEREKMRLFGEPTETMKTNSPVSDLFDGLSGDYIAVDDRDALLDQSRDHRAFAGGYVAAEAADSHRLISIEKSKK